MASDGKSEAILSEFLKGKRDRLTVATKFGLKPPSGLASKGKFIDIGESSEPLPGALKRAKAMGAGMGSSGNFSPSSAIESLDTSLRELRTDYVDLLLLHEATLDDALTNGLIEALERQVEAGKVRYLGIASDAEKLRDIRHLSASYSVLQFNDNVATQNVSLARGERRGIITHSIFKPMKPLIRNRATSRGSAQVCGRGEDRHHRSKSSQFPALALCAAEQCPWRSAFCQYQCESRFRKYSRCRGVHRDRHQQSVRGVRKQNS